MLLDSYCAAKSVGRVLFLLSATAALLLMCPKIDATTLSDNLTSPTGYTELVQGTDWIAAAFGTGSSAYNLSDITLLMQGDAGGTAALELYSNVNGAPGTRLGTLAAPSTFSSTLAPALFTATGILLAAENTYWAVLQPVSGTTEWAYTASNSGTGVGFQTFWAASYDAGTTWFTDNTQPMQMRVDAAPASATPEPGTAFLLVVAGAFAGVIKFRRQIRESCRIPKQACNSASQRPLSWQRHCVSVMPGLFLLFATSSSAFEVNNARPAQHRAPEPITFVTPKPAQAITNGSVNAEIQIASSMDSATLKVKLNGSDVTSRFTPSPGCGSSFCEKSGSLTTADGIRPGWNYLEGSVKNSKHAVGTATTRFFYRGGGLQSTSENYALFPFDVNFSIAANGDVTVGYAQNQYRGSTTYPANCGAAGFSVVVFDRTTLQLYDQKCFLVADSPNQQIQNYLSQLPYTTIVAVRGTSASSMSYYDMSPIGGTNFMLPGAPNANQYTAIGAGQGAPGVAYESFSRYGITPPGITGVLENISSGNKSSSATGAFYTFRPSDELGFTLSYTENNAADLVVEYNHNLPFGPGADRSNQDIPANQSVYLQKTAGSTPGILLWVLTRENMQLAAGEVFNPATDSNAYAELTQQLQSLHPSSAPFQSMDALVFIVLTQPQNFPMPKDQASLVSNLSREIQYLGGSATDFWAAVTQGKRFALVGTPANSIYVTNATSIVPYTTITSKQYSTEVDTQQNESGMLHGLLQRNHQMLLTPAQVVPIPNGNDSLWERDIVYQVGNSSPVPWPYLQDAQHQKAYAWLSEILVGAAFYQTAPSQHTSSSCQQDTCENVRFYYTGSEATALYMDVTAVKPEDPSVATEYCAENGNVSCGPPNAPTSTQPNCTAGTGALGFTLCDLEDEQKQLTIEYDYIDYVQHYATTLKTFFESESTNVGGVLAAAASNMETNLVQDLPEGAPAPAQSQVSLASNILNDTSGALSLFGTFTGDSNPLSGAASVLGGLLALSNDILTTESVVAPTRPTVDPYIVELSQIYNAVSNDATRAETYATDLSSAQDTFFTRIYSDWYRLQSVGLMAKNTQPGNTWYVAYTDGAAASGYGSLLTASVRSQFYLAVIPQQFVEDTYPGFANNYVQEYGDQPMVTQDIFNICYSGRYTSLWAFNNPSPSVFQDSGWLSIDGDSSVSQIASLVAWPWNYSLSQQNGINYEPGLPGMDVYVIRTVANAQGNFGYWSDATGTDLMGPSNSNITDGTGPLNLNQNWFFENIVPKVYLGCPAGGGPANFVPQ